MINSRTYHDLSPIDSLPFKRLLQAGVLLCLVNSLWALNPNKAISQYIHEQWGVEQGYPGGPIYAITQTPDGYLWIGTEKGLVRYDGFSFHLYKHADSPVFPVGPVLGLDVDGEGNLWIRVQGSHLLRYRDGVFQKVLPHLKRSEVGITAMCRGEKGNILFSGLANGAVRYTKGKFIRLAFRPSIHSFIISMAETEDGKVWIGTRDSYLYFLQGRHAYAIAKGLPDRKIDCLLPIGRSELLIGTDNGVVRWSGSKISRVTSSPILDHAQVLAMIRDRDSNLWVGTSHGLIRINAEGVCTTEPNTGHQGEPVSALFEDREGNIWVGTAPEIQQFRDTVFTTYSASTGLPSNENGPIYADSGGRTWFAPLKGGLYWLKNGHVGHPDISGLGKDVIYSISGGKGELWLGRRQGGLTHFHYGERTVVTKTYTVAQGLPQNSVFAVHENHDGTVWAGTIAGGVCRFRDGKFKTYTTRDGLVSNSISSILEGQSGTMWFGTAAGLSLLSKGRWRSFTNRDGLPPGKVNCLLQDASGVLWIGTDNGLAYLRKRTVHIPRNMPKALYQEVHGIEEDRYGSLWIAATNHIYRVNRDSLVDGTLVGHAVRQYGLSDGLLSAVVLGRYQSVIKDTEGRIWFSLRHGLSYVNPLPTTRTAPALVHILAISADGRSVNLRGPIQIQVPHNRITIRFTALSLSVPSRIRLMYRLDGFDESWSEPSATREATYTNLDPGSYRFCLLASNSGGLWNSSESTLKFEILPAFWQTWWFRLSCALAFFIAALLFYRMRMVSLAAQLNLRFEERLSERTRIAQELHDTLLQGFLSASMQLHVAETQLSSNSPARPLVAHVLDLMERVINEGRNAIRGLRSSAMDAQDLEQALSRLPQEFAQSTPIDFRVIIEGEAKPLWPAMRDEVYMVGREALANAIRHSRATKIETEIDYAPGRLRLAIRDNGRGIDPQIVAEGACGHWGLSGMQERAERMNAQLRVFSRGGTGTEVELVVPGNIAFKTRPGNQRKNWWRWKFWSSENVQEPKPKRE